MALMVLETTCFWQWHRTGAPICHLTLLVEMQDGISGIPPLKTAPAAPHRTKSPVLAPFRIGLQNHQTPFTTNNSTIFSLFSIT
jgi:hypothetical protein